MGTVLRFPAERVRGVHRPEPAAIVILPVVQIERESQHEEKPVASGFDAGSPGNGSNGRRRRARRS